MKAIKNGLIYQGNEFVEQKVLLYEETIVAVVDEEEYEASYKNCIEIDAAKNYVIPGMIDVHIHGSMGADVMDGTLEALQTIKKYLVQNGVTTFLATTMTMPIDQIHKALDAVKECMKNQKKETLGADIIGVHLEGPFLRKEYKGAQNEKDIIEPNRKLILEYLDLLKVVTIAPESPGALDLIEEFQGYVSFSLGHSGADFEQAMKAFEVGARGVTHLFNAMTGLHHRNPGIVGAAMASDCYCELIADYHHVHPGIFSMLTKVKGFEKLLLITDCMRAGGLPEGIYDLGGQEVTVSSGQCRLASGTIAGSVLKLNEGLINFQKATQEALEQLLPLVTRNQAKYLQMEDEIGSLEPGKRADIVLMNQEYEIEKTIVKGNLQYERQ
ncbi:MAG: N-acetylglucosamine-6-phosphate deacetylase [Vallitaleaceae bacterium]|nr:N-acetylglucosamine-6-phosphate deacetylase [Vallitaleaceae bacterium]